MYIRFKDGITALEFKQKVIEEGEVTLQVLDEDYERFTEWRKSIKGIILSGATCEHGDLPSTYFKYKPPRKKEEETVVLKKVDVWYLVVDGGDGSAYPCWYLSEKDAEKADDDIVKFCGYNLAEICSGRVETFEGSNIHSQAIENTEELKKVE